MGIHYRLKKQYYALPLSCTEVRGSAAVRKCDKERVAEKKYRRDVITFSGCNEIDFEPKICSEHLCSSRHLLNTIVPKRFNSDYSVMITADMTRWAFSCQREEIRTLLSARGTSISTGEMSVLSESFLQKRNVGHV